MAMRLDAAEIEGLFDYGYYLRHVRTIFGRLGFDAKEHAGAATAT